METRLIVEKIISGGQTGADQAALDFALQSGIPHGGWIPRGRMTENGPLDPKYALRQTSEARYEVRTERNVLEADATLIFHFGPLAGGSLLTWELAQRHAKPVRAIRLDAGPADPGEIRRWLAERGVRILNVAGSRASHAPQIGPAVREFLSRVFEIT